jgi:hypothetical protein
LRKIVFISILLSGLFRQYSNAQELFPLSEAASSIPKNALGIRLFSEAYKEVDKVRSMASLRLMYGVTSRFSVYLTGIASNHHGENFPVEFPFHNTPERGAKYPYKFNGMHLYGKYRFFSRDGKNEHFRMAAYAEGTLVKTTHHETEPDLEYGDNTGVGAGIIGTYLKSKFAVSGTFGGILPSGNSGDSPDPIDNLSPVPITIQYGKALTYSLSFGYLLLPKKYKDYNQTNVNLYLEFHGKAYQTAKVNLFVGAPNEYYLESVRYPPALQGNYFVDMSPGIQFIIRSNLRIDCTATFHMLGETYARLYPVYSIGIQQYLFFRNKR